ncbi:hypothetical protein HKX48_009323 [Thoreauomyces humboldtii]|nr:hypothetical protein HKX48_009323 [Thoreauomyces humboldtii]
MSVVPEGDAPIINAHKQTVLITGCTTGGIGHALALAFHRKGYRVFATARRTIAMSDLEASGIETLPLDVTSPSSISALLVEITKRTDALNFLINNAGQPFASAALDIDVDRARDMFETNLWGVVRMNAAFQHLIVQGRGTFVQVSSVGSFMPFVLNSAYTASKAALNAYSNTLRYEVAPLGVKVVTLVTGGVKTNIVKQDGQRLSFPVGGSYYARVGDAIVTRIEGEFDRGEDVHVYADTVVRRLTGRGAWFQGWSRNALPAQMWIGGSAALMWMASFFPVEIFTPMQNVMFGLAALMRDDAKRLRVEGDRAAK